VWVEAENLFADVEALVREVLTEGAETLAEVTSRVLPILPEPVHYAATGRIAEAMARRARVRSERERPWVPVLETLEVEDWAVDRGGAS
jgi:chromosome partition protein MukF